RCMEALERGDVHLSQLLESKAPTLYDRANECLVGGMMRHSHAVYLRRVTNLIDITRLPPEEQGARLRQWSGDPIDNQALLARVFVPARSRVVETLPRKLTIQRCAAAAVAAERYRRAHHRWPETLDALVRAGLLKSGPHDPYTGQPLRLRWLE